MCGVAGILAGPRAEPPDLEELRRMIAMLGHRGPDGYGLYRDDRVGLAHARLSIVGLAGGFQPIRNEDGSVWISFNGEIFNHVELRRELEARGHRFYTRTDTEVIVHAFEEWGPAAWARLNGQYAFALWEAAERRLWLVRDRMGILPMHYARVGDHIVFGSEVKALVAGGRVAPRFDGSRLARVFAHWSVAPHGSVFAGVEAVPAATALCIDETLAIRAERYWTPRVECDPALAGLSVDEAADALGERLGEAVRLRLRADVPVGVYISGGLDSSVIAGLVRRGKDGGVHSFGVRFADPAFDETEQQRRVAGFVGTEHHEILVGPREIQEALPDVVWHAETPLLRTAPAPMFMLSRLVQDNGIRVVLSGEGADELLSGYDVFKEDRVRRFWARRPDSAARARLMSRVHAFTAMGGNKASPLWQSFFRRGLQDTDDPFYGHRIRWTNTAWTQRLLSPDVRAAFDGPAAERAILDRLPEGYAGWSPLARAQAVEMDTFLTPYLLASQGDRVAMANSIEVRYPFLDPDVVELCNALPDRVKMLGLRDKLALRRLAGRLLPREVGHRPKRPYRAPMTTSLFGPQAPDYVHELLSERALDGFGLVDAAGVAQLAARAHRQEGRMAGEREEMALVGVLTLQMLAHAYREDFRDRATRARGRLEAATLHVLEDHAGARPAVRHAVRAG
ncbi:asparagine synthase (glutamine-hydrolyzing) [Azospirillum halopraeferens]|uniref:asparagine synthase (glutamine-hydrolyzing) n=1 Tax=Azospirillum halopraeferens TaxID=34010 RepID=UPI000684C7E6|nr:asparagine synthase (glutamine-hydrolyzing) [Azospirillum halopraeferens]